MGSPSRTLIPRITRHNVGGKRIFIADSHHHVLLPWHEISTELGQPPRLLTFDYHTDTHEAFLNSAFWHAKNTDSRDEDEWRQIADEFVGRMKKGEEATIKEAISKLKYDEHIDAAIRSGIIDVAFIVAYEASPHIVSNEQHALDAERDSLPESERWKAPRVKASPPFTYKFPENRMVVLEKRNDYKWLEPDDDDRPYVDNCLEAAFIEERLAFIDRICLTAGGPLLFQRPFILDIDLDYFNTKKSIQPNDPSQFHELIRRASAITVAREANCVKACQIPGERLTSKWLECQLMEHLKRALATGL